LPDATSWVGEWIWKDRNAEVPFTARAFLTHFYLFLGEPVGTKPYPLGVIIFTKKGFLGKMDKKVMLLKLKL